MRREICWTTTSTGTSLVMEQLVGRFIGGRERTRWRRFSVKFLLQASQKTRILLSPTLILSLGLCAACPEHERSVPTEPSPRYGSASQMTEERIESIDVEPSVQRMRCVSLADVVSAVSTWTRVRRAVRDGKTIRLWGRCSRDLAPRVESRAGGKPCLLSAGVEEIDCLSSESVGDPTTKNFRRETRTLTYKVVDSTFEESRMLESH